MRFDLLNQSIELNADESPSLYNALNMVRALFQDVEEAADASLSQCPIGDEKLPLEMIWLSKELIRIYEDNTDALQRNRARLDSIMEKLRSIQTELEELAQVQKLLPGKQAEYQKLQVQLVAAKVAQAAYEELLGKIEAAELTLKQLRGFDFDAANAKLRKMQDQIRELEDQTRDLRSQIEKLTDEVDKLREKIDQELRPEHDRLTRRKKSLLEEKERLQKEIGDLEKETSTLDEELEELRRKLPLRKRERDAAKRQVDNYRQKEYDPVITERDALLKTEKQLLEEKTAADQKIAELKENQRKLVMEVGRKKDQYDRDEKEYKKKQAEEQAYIEKQKVLTELLNKAIDDLAVRQEEYKKLNEETLPDAKKYLDDETKRRDELQEKIDGFNRERKEKLDKIAELEKELPTSQEKLRNARSRYDALRLSYNANNSDLQELERKLLELKEKNDKDRIIEYRAQLVNEQQELEALSENCAQMEKEIEDLSQKIQAEEQKKQVLDNRKKTLEEGRESIDELLQALAPFDTEECRRKANHTAAQFEMLCMARDNLASSVCVAYRYFSGLENAAGDLDIKWLEDCLNNASEYSRAMYRSLINCSETLKTYYREEN